MLEKMYDCQRSWIEIDLNALRHNVNELTSLLDTKDQFMAVMKADGYGHGAVRLSQELNQMGIYNFAVATLSEAIELRKNGIKGNILILGYTDPSYAFVIQKYHFIQTVIDYDYALSLQQQNIDIQVHIAIDTGMHRLGNTKEELSKIKKIYAMSHLHIKGIFSHLCVSDEHLLSSQQYTQYQIDNFSQIIESLKRDGFNVGKVHIQSSYGLLNYSYLHYDYVRVGIAMYGVYSCQSDMTNAHIVLKPVLSLKSKIILIRHIDPNETIGYGRTFQARRKMKIAVVPIGYADGLPRDLSNQGTIIVHGQLVSIVGRICMDQLMIDITNIDDVAIGDIVTIIGHEGKTYQGVEKIAQQANSISNEILSQLGQRLPRLYK